MKGEIKMSLRGINNIFGWGFIIIGALRVLMIFLAILAIFSNLSAIYSGGAVSSIDNVSTLSTCIGFAQIFLGLRFNCNVNSKYI